MLKNSGEEIRELLERWVLPTLVNFLSFVVLLRISNEMIVAVGFLSFLLIPSEPFPEPGAAQRTNQGQGGKKN